MDRIRAGLFPGKIQMQTEKSAQSTSFNLPTTENVNDQMNALVLEAKGYLENETRKTYAMGFMSPSRVETLHRREEWVRSFRPELGFLLHYLGHSDTNSPGGPYHPSGCGENCCFRPTWIFCIYPVGLYAQAEIYDPNLLVPMLKVLNQCLAERSFAIRIKAHHLEGGSYRGVLDDSLYLFPKAPPSTYRG